MFRLAAVLLCLAIPALAHAQAPDTLKKIRDSKTLTIAYRTDALPFSFGRRQAAGRLHGRHLQARGGEPRSSS